jgi:type I restriction enzyme S subunit
MKAQDLKNSILQLAIQGKLVEQREDEGTARELIEQIQAEKELLIKEKKIKKEKPLPTITEDEIPFDIPGSWEWVRMGNVVDFINGRAYKKEELLDQGKYRVLRVGNFFTNNSWYYSNMELEDSKYCNNGDLLYAWSASFGPKIWDGDKTIFHYHIWKVNFDGQLFYRDYLYWFLLQDVNIIKKSTTGSTMVHVSMINMKPRLISIPPLAEQKRIVEKIEELMPYVDQYDKAYTEVEELNKKFPEDMQKSILQYAIQGKLVEQREEEGTAEELYQKIQAEKEKLIKEGKIKKSKPLPEITEDEIPFDIPESWKWVRLGDSLDIARGGSPRPIKAFITDSEDGVNWIKIGDTDKGGKYINSTNEKIIKEGMKKSRFVKKGDFLLSNSMSFGRPYILNIDGCIHDGWLVLSQITEVFNKDFLYYLLSSRMVFNQFQSIVSGAVVNNLNSDKVRLTIVPIPPLEEQKRIVEKIEELLPHTKQLVKKLD